MPGKVSDKFRHKSRAVVLNGNEQGFLLRSGEDTDDPLPVHCRSPMQHRILDQRLQDQLGNDEFLKIGWNIDQKLELVFEAELLDESVLPDIGEILLQGAEGLSFQGHPLDVRQCGDGFFTVLRSSQIDQAQDAV